MEHIEHDIFPSNIPKLMINENPPPSKVLHRSYSSPRDVLIIVHSTTITTGDICCSVYLDLECPRGWPALLLLG
ncbi:hypothetical protein EYF80_018123 [Liparis tanakae]|uniref:Uncharacterized protein n=1 Tax=Liparis tanakae TaxID=230148 RepID=A0A4Z2I117_9TELE|nr:hypothetical protein EYF80_018123 [Liparis tanakae]